MIRILDGPAAGAELGLQRAPMYLRVVIGPGGKVDALDLMEDMPAPDEVVHVYARCGDASVAFICRPARGSGRRVVMASYDHLPDVDAVTLNLYDTAAWRAWAAAQPEL
jgi:hypothetical protein